MTLPAEGATDPLALDDDVRERRARQHDASRWRDKTAFAHGQTCGFEITPPADGKPLEFTGAAEKFTATCR